MNIKKLKQNWDALGEEDPYWAVLTEPSKINKKWKKEAFYLSGQQELGQLFSKAAISPDNHRKGTVLDFGCGPGRMSQALCSHYQKVTGVDISSSMIALAQRNNQHAAACEYFVNDQADLKLFDSDSFDLVFSYITLQHIEKKYIKNYLKEFVRVCRPGGYLLFNLPATAPISYRLIQQTTGNALLNSWRKWKYKKKGVIEMHCLAKEEVLDLLNKLGVKSIKTVVDPSVGKDWESYLYVVGV